jgi:hypothetical protein
MLRRCVKCLRLCLHLIIHHLNWRHQQWTKPDSDSLVTGTLTDVTCSRRDVIAKGLAVFLNRRTLIATMHHRLINASSPPKGWWGGEIIPGCAKYSPGPGAG